jgi:group I intron endonuclease
MEEQTIYDLEEHIVSVEEHVIYALVEPDTSWIRYIGYSSNKEERYDQHYKPYSLKKNTHKNAWLKCMLKRGLRAEMIVLERYQTDKELPGAEVKMIAFCRQLGYPLTNMTDGGDGQSPGHKTSEETRKKLSEATKGEKNGFYGRTHTEEAKKLIGAKSRARNTGAGNPSYGKPFSDERKRKISEAIRGENHSSARLTEDDIRAMKKAMSEGARNKELAIQYGPDPSAVSKIRHGHKWKHIP